MTALARLIVAYRTQAAFGASLEPSASQPTVSVWVRAGRVPGARVPAVLRAARTKGVEATAEELLGLDAAAIPAAAIPVGEGAAGGGVMGIEPDHAAMQHPEGRQDHA